MQVRRTKVRKALWSVPGTELEQEMREENKEIKAE